MVSGTISVMDIAPQLSLPADGPQTLIILDLPGAVRLGPTNGLEVQLKVSAGTVTLTPYYWLAGSWWPIGDATFAPKSITATFATVPAASARFARATEGLYWALLSTGGGTVTTCNISEAVY